MNKLLKVGLIGMVALLSVGCKSRSGLMSKVENNKEQGVIYGSSGVSSILTVRKACEMIKNKDDRCKEAGSYHLVEVITKFGFSSAAWGGYALVEKNHPSVNKLFYKGAISDKKAPFVKVRMNEGRFADLLEVVSTDGDGKCKWSGFNKNGGVVCEAYNYDYRKDYKGINF